MSRAAGNPAALKTAVLFAEQRYVLVPQLVPDPLRALCYQHAMDLAGGGGLQSDDQVPDTPAAYGDAIMEMLLQRLLPEIERLSGLKLFPTYSYFRVYKAGDKLKRHRDRPSCEVSVSINLGESGASPWPLWVEGPRGVSAVPMAPGDGLLYRGIECAHWREAFDGDHAAQVFLHYVEQGGPNAEWQFDKRPPRDG